MTTDNNPSERSNTNIIWVVIVVAIIIASIIFWVLNNHTSDNGGMRQITYQVQASGGYAQIIYTDITGTVTAPIMVTTPFFKTISLPIGDQVYLTASNPSQTGDVSCNIKIDNKDWKESHGTHPIDSVACAGIIR
jgi:hypothetical protein